MQQDPSLTELAPQEDGRPVVLFDLRPEDLEFVTGTIGKGRFLEGATGEKSDHFKADALRETIESLRGTEQVVGWGGFTKAMCEGKPIDPMNPESLRTAVIDAFALTLTGLEAWRKYQAESASLPN